MKTTKKTTKKTTNKNAKTYTLNAWELSNLETAVVYNYAPYTYTVLSREVVQHGGMTHLMYEVVIPDIRLLYCTALDHKAIEHILAEAH